MEEVMPIFYDIQGRLLTATKSRVVDLDEPMVLVIYE